MAKRTLDQHTIVPFSQSAIAKTCSLRLLKRENKNFAEEVLNCRTLGLKNGDRIYAFSKEVPHIVWKKVLQECSEKRLQLDFFFLDEPFLNMHVLQAVYPVARHIYLTNNVFPRTPKLHTLPIAFVDRTPIRATREEAEYYANDASEREIKCLMRFKVENNIQQRGQAVHFLGKQPFVTNLNEVDLERYVQTVLRNLDGNNKSQLPAESARTHVGGNTASCEAFYEVIKRSRYVLDPAGCGVATHRFWESIYFGAIPIVKRTNTALDLLYEFFPCMIVNAWFAVNEDYLDESYECLKTRLIEFNHKYPDFFTNTERMIAISKEHL